MLLKEHQDDQIGWKTIYLCWRSFSATGSNGSSFIGSTVLPFFSVALSEDFLGAFSVVFTAGAAGAWQY